jgi:hypothetical protein
MRGTEQVDITTTRCSNLPSDPFVVDTSVWIITESSIVDGHQRIRWPHAFTSEQTPLALTAVEARAR